MILAVIYTIDATEYIEASKSQDSNGFWTHDLMTPVRCFNQLSYEATDSGN